jgi:hypothetical protein
MRKLRRFTPCCYLLPLVLGLVVACGDDGEVGETAVDSADPETSGDGDPGDGDPGDGDPGDGDPGDGDPGDGDPGDGDPGDGDPGDGDPMCAVEPGVDACDECAMTSCCAEWLACDADEHCSCMRDCVGSQVDIPQCSADCGVVGVNQPFVSLTGCITAQCATECSTNG